MWSNVVASQACTSARVVRATPLHSLTAMSMSACQSAANSAASSRQSGRLKKDVPTLLMVQF